MVPTAAKRALRTATKATARAADILRPPDDGLVVLIYHRVGGGTGGDVDLPPDAFDRQLAHLRAEHDVVDLGEALDTMAGRRAAVAVTFDDGTADFLDHALPALVRHRVPATLYVATAFVEERRAFPWGAPPVSWAGLAEAVSTGLITVGSHTHTHALLDRVDEAQAADDLDRSIDLIGARLGVVPDHFAYPKAVLGTAEVRRRVAERFRTAAIAGTRPNPWGHTNLQRLFRSPIQRSDGERWFRYKAAGGLAFEDSLRRRLNRFRYAGAVT